MIGRIINDKSAAVGAAGFFIMLVSCLILGGFIYLILSPLFESINQTAIMLFSGSTSKYYPENVQSNTLWILTFIEYSIVVFFIFISGYYVKGYLQPWTRG